MSPRFLLRTRYDLAGTGGGGAGNLMRNLARAMAAEGWDVDVLCPYSNETSPSDGGVSYRRFDYPEPNSGFETILNTVRGVRRFVEVRDQTEFDVVLDDISHYPYFPAHFLCPSDAANALFMHTAFFGAAREYVGPIRGSVIDLIDRSLPHLNEPDIVCAGPSTESRIHQTSDYHQTHILNPCIDIEKFDYRFEPRSKDIVYLGRLGVRKNVSCLLRAWAFVERAGFSEYTLNVAGTGEQEEHLHQLANQLGLEQVRFLGFVSEERKRTLLSDALVCVIPSKMEGYVTTGVEALASGTPVVGADTYGINDYIHNGETGFLFDVDDHRHLATVLQRCFKNPAVLEPIARTGRDLAENHSFDQFSSRADEVFRTVADV